MSLDGFSLSPLIDELNQKLTGGRIDKIFQIDKHTLRLVVRILGCSVCLVISTHPDRYRMNLSTSNYTNPDTPPAFCMLLRKHLEDGRIASITQYKKDRVAIIAIDVRGEKGLIETKYLITELMGKNSNIILAREASDNQMQIVDSIRRISSSMSRQRTILPNIIYNFPPDRPRFDLEHVSTPPLLEALKQQTSLSLVKALIQVASGLGPLTAKEIAYRAGFSPEQKVASMDIKDWDTFTIALAEFMTPIINKQFQPTVAVSAEQTLAGMTAFPLTHLSNTCSLKTFTTMSEAVEFANNLKGIYHSPNQNKLLKIVTNEIAKLERKLGTLHTELIQANEANQYKSFGDILMTYLYRIPPHTTEVVLPDLYSENPHDTVNILLKPELSGVENAQYYYNKYNKLKRAQELIALQETKGKQEIEYLQTILYALEQELTAEDCKEITEELTAANYIHAPTRKKKTAVSLPRKFITQDQFIILVGKNNRQNDYITFKLAKSGDLWFHAKNIPGSHVILRTEDKFPPESAVLSAAKLAAFFSKAKESENVPVDYTKRKYVKKPSGARPGFVIYQNQTTLYINPEIPADPPQS